jgi:putative ATP-grasp target RiPP
MGTYDMVWRDPLSTPGDRFPLGPPPEFWADSDDEPSEVGIRPYSLRGVVAAPKAEVGLDVSYSYDPERQITLVRDTDGVVVPLSKHTKPGPTPSVGTSETRDGGGPGNPPGEEMLPPDYQED